MLFLIFFDPIRKPTYLEYLGDQTIEVAFPISMSFLKIARLLKKAGLSDSYKAHAGFQQIPIKPGSVNWIGISPSAEDGLEVMKMVDYIYNE